MKCKSVVIMLMLTICAGLLPAWGDVLPEGHHRVARDAVITNLSAYPDLVLIGYITGPTISPSYEAYRIEEHVPLHMGYKFNQLRLFAMPRAVFEEAGGLAEIDMRHIAETFPSIPMVSFYDTVPNRNPINAERYYYRITATSATGITLTLEQRVLSYNNGRPDKVIVY